MNEIFIIAGDYLKGKSVYPSFRRLLNLLFNISISSFIYEKCYGSYSWLNYNDYKGILDFFIIGMYVLMISYRFLDIIPTLMRKFHHQAEEYLKLHLEHANDNTDKKE